ncbi:hypothetical protein KFK09_018350 [Dendrobium nobile]|uniref:Reverse transcriptase domain-containing protein n=1 Tax=Dendrobium nobile TaxID=94219 RepID=A0A8T3AVL2_DENNO|nr:hypothetical protein KFK09_018350 [Dendrobium nobile]
MKKFVLKLRPPLGFFRFPPLSRAFPSCRWRDPSLSNSVFPSLHTSSLPSRSMHHVPPAVSSQKPLPWTRVLADNPNPSLFAVSAIPTPEDIIPFAHEDVVEASSEWNMALAGYSLGKRPFYGSLLATVSKVWKLKGSIKMISLNDGFFLFKFSSAEDFEYVWNKGIWFILGKPFVLQKWSPLFSPKREEFTSVPIWIKILDLPLCCWTPTGVSKIATKIGIPLAVDDLTATKSRLTYARVCVQVDATATYPEFIPILVEGKIFNLKILYEWKPIPCDHCSSLIHVNSECPNNPNPQTLTQKPIIPPRGRSSSRKPKENIGVQNGILSNPEEQRTIPEVSVIGSHKVPLNIPNIPNLNCPNEDLSSSESSNPPTQASPPLKAKSPVVQSSNKFSVLQDNSDLDPDPEVQINQVREPQTNLTFGIQNSVLSTLPSYTHDTAILSIVYASNSQDERISLWEDIRRINPLNNLPWIVTGDFNCCRFISEKAGGNPLSVDRMGHFNSLIFDTALTDLTSTGSSFPIHLTESLTKPVTFEEVKNVVFAGHSDSAPGPDGLATDNPILADEIMKMFNNTRRDYFCAKFYIKKSFDTVSREFLISRMTQKGFPNVFTNWVKTCITNVNFSICLNGSLEGFFSSSTGLRQGCPLSPYLFCIIMDSLSCLIDDHANMRNFKGISIGEFHISHLLYADDLIAFGEANNTNYSNLIDILDYFSACSGLHMNNQKSSVSLSRPDPTGTDPARAGSRRGKNS